MIIHQKKEAEIASFFTPNKFLPMYTIHKFLRKLYQMIFSLFILCSCSHKNKSIPLTSYNNYLFSKEDQLQVIEHTKKIDHFFSTGEEGYFKGKKNTQIYYKAFVNPQNSACIVISSGRTEATIKYKELIFDLCKNGYDVYINDHRGQGFSNRLTEYPQMGYIDQFQYYIDDLKTFYEHFVNVKSYQKKYLLAHSMGGAIGITYVEQHPSDFDAACFSAPMLALDAYIKPLVKILRSKHPRYALGQKDFNDDVIGFEKNKVTGSKIRYQRNVDMYLQHPKAQLGGVSYQWLQESIDQFNYIFSHIHHIKTPFLLLSPTKEQIVNPKGLQKFVKKATKQKLDFKFLEIIEAKHEVFMEKDVQRNFALTQTLDFFKKH